MKLFTSTLFLVAACASFSHVSCAQTKTPSGARVCWCNGKTDEDQNLMHGLACTLAGGFAKSFQNGLTSALKITCALDGADEPKFKAACTKFKMNPYCENINKVEGSDDPINFLPF